MVHRSGWKALETTKIWTVDKLRELMQHLEIGLEKSTSSKNIHWYYQLLTYCVLYSAVEQ